MTLDVLNCQLIDVGGRAYRVVGNSAVATHVSRGDIPAVSFAADDNEDLDLDEGSSFDVQKQDSQYLIRLAYDAEVL